MTAKQIKMLLVEAYRKWELDYDDNWLQCYNELKRMLDNEEYEEEKDYENNEL